MLSYRLTHGPIVRLTRGPIVRLTCGPIICLENKHILNIFTAIVDLSRSNFSIARVPIFQLKSAT